jgi:D-glycero-D-manno-heptose 1,7-bisphosphate phosphatase
MMNEDSYVSPAIFVDRDGVIIRNSPTYVRTLKQVKIYPRAVEAIALAAKTNFKIVMVTNQAGVSKGLYTLDTVNAINREIVRVIECAGGRIDGVYVCPHQNEDHCDCRKPKPGLLKNAASDLKIDLQNSFMIGDALTDMLAGQHAGVRQSILVLTGRGISQRKLAAAGEVSTPFIVRKSILEAVHSILI